MKPKNKFQKQVFEASKTLSTLTKTQIKWAYQNCLEHVGRRLKSGVINCLECGHSWKSKQTLIDSVCGCTCPNCRMSLKLQDTLKRVFKDYQYLCIVTAYDGFQVLRFIYVESYARVGEKARYYHSEVVQRWIAPNGKYETIARTRPMSYYADNWTFRSNLEIRPEREHHNIRPACIYPRMQLIPELKRSGFDGNFYRINPFSLFRTLLSYNRAETLLKARQTNLLKYFIINGFDRIENYWSSIKVCIRNGYQIKDASIWRDYIDLLRFFGKDLHNAKYVCPADLNAEHDRYVIKKREWQKRQDKEKAKIKAMEAEKSFKEMKSRFFGIQFSDGLIQVNVLESVLEIMEESDALHHCAFVNNYHLKPDSLILSACIGDQKIETVEISLSQLKVLQCRGAHNKNTEYHDRIIKLVNKNISVIKKRLAA